MKTIRVFEAFAGYGSQAIAAKRLQRDFPDDVEFEEWRDIPGYEGLYQVSNLGRVKSLERVIYFPANHRNKAYSRIQKERIVRPITMGGYLGFNVGNKKKMYVHRAVALAFIPNTDNKSDVNHIDGDKHNNRLENLEWATRKENMRHAFSNGLVGYHNPSNKKKVRISLPNGFEKIFECIECAAKYIGVCTSGVSRACTGEKPHAGGYKCEFV